MKNMPHGCASHQCITEEQLRRWNELSSAQQDIIVATTGFCANCKKIWDQFQADVSVAK